MFFHHVRVFSPCLGWLSRARGVEGAGDVAKVELGEGN